MVLPPPKAMRGGGITVSGGGGDHLDHRLPCPSAPFTPTVARLGPPFQPVNRNCLPSRLLVCWACNQLAALSPAHVGLTAPNTTACSAWE